MIPRLDKVFFPTTANNVFGAYIFYLKNRQRNLNIMPFDSSKKVKAYCAQGSDLWSHIKALFSFSLSIRLQPAEEEEPPKGDGRGQHAEGAPQKVSFNRQFPNFTEQKKIQIEFSSRPF